MSTPHDLTKHLHDLMVARTQAQEAADKATDSASRTWFLGKAQGLDTAIQMFVKTFITP